MSVNITIPISLEAVAGVLDSTDPAKMADALAALTKAAVAKVNALPAGVKNRALAATTVEDDDDVMSILSFDSEAPAPAPTPTPSSPLVRKRPAKAPVKKVKRTRKQYAPQKTMQVFVRDTMSSMHTLEVTPDLTIREFKVRVQAKTGCPPCEMRLIFGGQQLEDSRTLQEYNIQKEATISHVLRLRGS